MCKGTETDSTIQWLIDCDEPWTRYRTYKDLLEREPSDPDMQQARKDTLTHPLVKSLVIHALKWEKIPLKRHNDAAHPLYALKTLADFGVNYHDTQIQPAVDLLVKHQSEQGALQSLLTIHPRYGGTGKDTWSWMNCDAFTILYILKAMDAPYEDVINRALEHLIAGTRSNGWPCLVAPEFAGFRGPGRKDDPCPIVNVYVLDALLQFPEEKVASAVHTAANMLLSHWEHRTERKLYLFGIGTDFRKLKYPFIWYDILHVVEALSQIPQVRTDQRFVDMVTEIIQQQDADGRFTASSMFRAWKGWSFADKTQPSPWLTLLILRIVKRLQLD